MIKYALPGLYEHYPETISFLKLMDLEPDIFYDNVGVGAVYGNFQFCTWDGGRIFDSYKHTTLEEIKKLKFLYNEKYNIPMRFVFTNSLLQPEDCYDRFNNLVLVVCDNSINEIVLNSSILEEYIKKNYPNYKLISSTTKCLNNFDLIKNELDNNNYSLVCLDYNLNNALDFFNTLNENQIKKTELLVNAICPPACPNRSEHYRLNSLFSLNYGKQYNIRTCGIQKNNLYPNNYKTFLTPDQIKELNNSFGISNFKLEGRTFNSITYICNIVKYMVKPEYHLYAINILSEMSSNFNLWEEE